MTSFTPPPYPPIPAYGEAQSGPPRWSATAIAALILAILGCLGITAVLGLVFAIVGIFATRGGRRRGMGLAIAAIPISLVTGAFSVLAIIAFMLFGRMAEVPGKLPSVFAGGGETGATTLRELATPEWNESVNDEPLREWLRLVQKKHGALTAAALDMQQGVTMSPEGNPRIAIAGKFVNGAATIRVSFEVQDLWSVRIADIEVDGSSPLRPAEPSPAAVQAPPPAPP